MRKLTFLLAFALVFFYACNKQETTPTTDNQQVEATDDWAYVLKHDGDEWVRVTPDELQGTQSNTGTSDLKQNNSAHMHGDFGPNLPGLSGVFSGTQNNGGTHGSATLTYANNTYTLETECVMVEENEAVYGGMITAMSSPNPFFLPQVGDYMYFKVIDNGQGNNAPADQYHGLIRNSKTSKCGVWTPGSAAWPETLFGFPMVNDIPEPGFVKVNN